MDARQPPEELKIGGKEGGQSRGGSTEKQEEAHGTPMSGAHPRRKDEPKCREHSHLFL